MAHWAFGVNLILVFTCSDYRGPIYMGSNVTPWVNTGIFPDKLKLATVIPFLKKGNPSLLNNYRSISLLPVISKVIDFFYFQPVEIIF